ncbi:hypothetical protein EDC01DRAFT_733061 [Geopyxis carbonaria]|nr:hypothetical protein EDC01DRAFT_733061 [Geopyxis carbonaria]
MLHDWPGIVCGTVGATQASRPAVAPESRVAEYSSIMLPTSAFAFCIASCTITLDICSSETGRAPLGRVKHRARELSPLLASYGRGQSERLDQNLELGRNGNGEAALFDVAATSPTFCNSRETGRKSVSCAACTWRINSILTYNLEAGTVTVCPLELLPARFIAHPTPALPNARRTAAPLAPSPETPQRSLCMYLAVAPSNSLEPASDSPQPTTHSPQSTTHNPQPHTPQLRHTNSRQPLARVCATSAPTEPGHSATPRRRRHGRAVGRPQQRQRSGGGSRCGNAAAQPRRRGAGFIGPSQGRMGRTGGV